MLDLHPNARRFLHKINGLAPDHGRPHKAANCAEMIMRHRQGKSDPAELAILREELARMGLSLEDLDE